VITRTSRRNDQLIDNVAGMHEKQQFASNTKLMPVNR